MIAVDTNLLVYAYRPGVPFHGAARSCLTTLAEGRAAWAIPWPCIHEFVAVVTHPRIFSPPAPLADALGQVNAWLESPSLVVLAEADGYWPALCAAATASRTVGAMIHDARIAALCRLHGISELWSADRDFGRFPSLVVRNPLVPDGVRDATPAYLPRRRAGARLRRPRTSG